MLNVYDEDDDSSTGDSCDFFCKICKTFFQLILNSI